MTQLSLAALDMAGTTIDERGLVYEAVASAVADAVGGPVPSELLGRWKGTAKDAAIAGLLRDLGEDASPARVSAVFEDFVDRVTQSYRETPPVPIPGVLEAFEELRARDVRVVLQTGYAARIADPILAGLGWEIGDTVDGLVTNDLVPASRPAPYLIFRAMEATGVTDVRRVLVAGDTPNDLAAGMNAGAAFVVGVLTGSFSRAQLEGEPHTHILDSIAELPSLV